MTSASEAARASALLEQHLQRVHSRTDRVFATLMVGQWVFAILVAVLWSPYGWEGKVRAVHVHVQAAVLLGGLLSSFPILLSLVRPGWVVTRHVNACVQMLWSALLIHLSGGRIEAHFHVFGSLAFVAFYRDWRVLVSATLVVVVDHLLRGLVWPESVYGVATPEWWRFLEHAFWVVFEDIVLVVACVRGAQELRDTAARQAEVEALSESEMAKKSADLARALGELQASQDTLVRTEKLAAVGQPAASVAHEVKNPLGAIRNATRLVTKRLGEDADPRTRQFLALIDQQAVACARIVNDLIDFARERPLELRPCPMRDLVDEALGVVVVSADRPANHPVVFENAVPGALPPPTLDPGHVRQVVINLVQNAAEAIPPDRRGLVTVGASDEYDVLRLTVQDDGAGIPAELLAQVFLPLFTTKTKGTGLGLAIVRSIATRHGGDVSLASEVGRGTTVTVELPMRAARAPAVSHAQPTTVA